MKPRAWGSGLAAIVGLALTGAPAAAQGTVFVNTTEDLPPEPQYCLPAQICPLRSAIERAEGGATVRACYDATEIAEGKVPKGKPCRGAAKPLTTADPGYDPATGKWVFDFSHNLPYTLGKGRARIDFTADIDGWAGPADNKIAIGPGDNAMDHAIVIESSENVLQGFDVRGEFTNAAITIRAGLEGGNVVGNQLGPGLVFAALPGIGVRMSGPEVKNNRFVGNWCGIGGDGTRIERTRDDCVQLADGTAGNQIGGPEAKDRNIFAASDLGSGVIVQDIRTTANVIEGNWFGLDATGKKAGNEAGITIKLGARGTRITGNVISGNDQSGISIFDNSAATEITANTIGESPDGSTCVGNGNYGVSMTGSVDDSLVSGNRIACNVKGGVLISGAGCQKNRVTRNSITRNNNDAIRVASGANGNIRLPTINNTTATRVVGAACPGCVVEVFSDTGDEAEVFEGEVQADLATGLFIFDKPEGFRHVFVKAVGTDPNGNSSGLSVKRAVPVGRTPTATAVVVSPTPWPTTTATPGTPGTPQTPEATPTTVGIRDVFVPAVFKAFALTVDR
ncbi:MAG: right-handed parallel beta-helix repeat-containing protein [Chloroflexi bacterium CFX6]|nr:right-handed parallel beta-helix repeat-containing protein [Chloroflexi bacterium CFX6]